MKLPNFCKWPLQLHVTEGSCANFEWILTYSRQANAWTNAVTDEYMLHEYHVIPLSLRRIVAFALPKYIV